MNNIESLNDPIVIDVSGVDPVYNEKGRIVEWTLDVIYEHKIPFSDWVHCADETYTFKPLLFNLGYDRAWKLRIKLLARMDKQKN